MKNLFLKICVVLTLVFLSFTHGQAQTNAKLDAVLDTILSQMIPLNDRVSMSKFPVSVAEYLAVVEVFSKDVEPQYKTLALPNGDFHYPNHRIENEFIQWYDLRYLQFVKDYPKTKKEIGNMPITGVQYDFVYRFLAELSERYEKRFGKRVTFRLPMINEWEQAAQEYPTLGVTPKQCNYFEVPQNWMRFNPRTQTNDVIYPYSFHSEHIFIELTNRDAFPPNRKGFYDLYGNAAEMMYEYNQTRGGTCISSGYDILHSATLKSDLLPQLVGFRVVMVLPEKIK